MISKSKLLNHVGLLLTAIIFELSSAVSVGAIESKAPVNWIKKQSDIPDKILSYFTDCNLLEYPISEIWDENARIGGYFIDINNSQRLYIVACESAGYDVYDAVVLFKNNIPKRLSFPDIDDHGKPIFSFSVPNTRLEADKTLTTEEFNICFGKIGATSSYQFVDRRFELLRKEVKPICEEPSWQLKFEKKP